MSLKACLNVVSNCWTLLEFERRDMSLWLRGRGGDKGIRGWKFRVCEYTWIMGWGEKEQAEKG